MKKLNTQQTNLNNFPKSKGKVLSHFRLKSTIEDFIYEDNPLLIWINPKWEATPDLTELLYQFHFPN